MDDTSHLPRKNPAFVGRTSRTLAPVVHHHFKQNASRKFTEAEVHEIRRLAADYVAQQTIANHYGVSQTVISFIVNRRTYKWVP